MCKERAFDITFKSCDANLLFVAGHMTGKPPDIDLPPPPVPPPNESPSPRKKGKINCVLWYKLWMFALLAGSSKITFVICINLTCFYR